MSVVRLRHTPGPQTCPKGTATIPQGRHRTDAWMLLNHSFNTPGGLCLPETWYKSGGHPPFGEQVKVPSCPSPWLLCRDTVLKKGKRGLRTAGLQAGLGWKTAEVGEAQGSSTRNGRDQAASMGAETAPVPCWAGRRHGSANTARALPGHCGVGKQLEDKGHRVPESFMWEKTSGIMESNL